MAERGPERLHKLLARAGVTSRRNAEEMIRAGRVSVNGETVTKPGTTADLQHDRVAVDGKLVEAGDSGVHTYLVLNKPAGVVSTVRDPQGRRTVVDLVAAAADGRLFPVGRLDADSEGLLLLTDDGDLTYRLTQARYRVEKEYHARVQGFAREETLHQLVRPGVELDDGVARAVRAAVLDADRRGGGSWVRVVLHEGRKREVRRMLAAIGHPVLMLKRVRLGSLRLGTLAVGEWRSLEPEEVEELRAGVGLSVRSGVVGADAS